MNFLRQMLSESNGQVSTTRVMCWIALIVAIVKAFTTTDFAMVSLWVGVAFSAKIGGKIFEDKTGA